jgi:hypothetical protein
VPHCSLCIVVERDTFFSLYFFFNFRPPNTYNAAFEEDRLIHDGKTWLDLR